MVVLQLILQVPDHEATEGLGETETGHGYYKPCHALKNRISRHEQRLQSHDYLPSSAPAFDRCGLKGGSTGKWMKLPRERIEIPRGI